MINFFKRIFKKKQKNQKQNVKFSLNLQKLLDSNEELKYYFLLLINRFEQREMTVENAFLMKKFMEELFQNYGIEITFHVNKNLIEKGIMFIEIKNIDLFK